MMERRDGPHGLPDDLPVRLTLGIPVTEFLLLSAGFCHDFEGGVGMYSLMVPRMMIFVRPRRST